MKTLIKNQTEWVEFARNIGKKYNINNAVIRGEPETFPATVYTSPFSDAGSYGVKCIFFYQQDAFDLINSNAGKKILWRCRRCKSFVDLDLSKCACEWTGEKSPSPWEPII